MRRQKIVLMLLLIFLSALTIPLTAHATLFDGKDLRICYLYPDVSTEYARPKDVVVGPGIEADYGYFGHNTPRIDVSDTSILFNFYVGGAAASFNGFQFTDYTNTIDAFSSVLIADTNLAFDASRIRFDENNIWVNFQGLGSNSMGFVSLSVNAVPEPATVLLLGSGLLGLIGLKRKMKK